jgi:two-component system, cell cycle sensor histidine kinase and response regulator CckA
LRHGRGHAALFLTAVKPLFRAKTDAEDDSLTRPYTEPSKALTESMHATPALPPQGSADLSAFGAVRATDRPLLDRPLRGLQRLSGPLMLVIVVLAVAAFWFWPSQSAQAAAASAAALLTLCLLVQVRVRSAPAVAVADALLRRLANDPDGLILTDLAGRSLARSSRAGRHHGHDPALAAQLDGWCAEPVRVIDEVIAEIGQNGRARREFRRAEVGLRLTAHAVGPAATGAGSPGVVLWRLAVFERSGRRGIDALGVPILTLGADGQPIAVNPALSRLLGLAEGAGLAGHDHRVASSPTIVPRDPGGVGLAAVMDQITAVPGEPKQPFALQLPGGQPAKAYPVMARDGPCDMLIVPDGGPDLSGVVGRLPDHEDIPVALVQLDPEGRICGTNRAARSLLGLAPAEGRFLWEVVEGLGRPVSDWLHDARAGRALNRPEVLRAQGGGAETFVQIILRRASPPAPAGALVAVVSDATELKSLEARFVQSQKMQAIGQLAGGIAHDFNNLLTAITGHCDLLLMGRDVFDPDYGDLQQIQQNANRAAALVRQLLAFSRKQTLQPEVLSVEALIDDVVRLLGRLVGERITLRIGHDPALRPIRADRRQLEQVIVNLVVNARDAMPMGGTIRIETEALSLAVERSIGRVMLSAGDWSVIRVIDSGVGIPADMLDKIFEPFFTTKRPGEGTGLGLSTAYGIVKQMGGFIFVDSIEGTGATFSLYFAADAGSAPAAKPKPDGYAMTGAVEKTPAPAQSLRGPPRRTATDAVPAVGASGLARKAQQLEPPPAERSGTILLVEDEAPVRAFAARALRLEGYQVLEATDGEGALEILTERPVSIDAIVTDVIMPGLDGPSWVAQALTLRPGLPVIYVSGYIEEALIEALGRTPNAVFLEKPFSLVALTQTLAAQLDAAHRR